jgi:hypothetical protein
VNIGGERDDICAVIFFYRQFLIFLSFYKYSFFISKNKNVPAEKPLKTARLRLYWNSVFFLSHRLASSVRIR